MRQEHGISNHPLYHRWNSIISRCYNKNDRSYKTYGAHGIEVEYIWNRLNPKGIYNFIEWVEEEVAKKMVEDPNFLKTPFNVARIKIDQNFGPENCHLASMRVATQNRPSTKLSVEKVVQIRRHKRENPDSSLSEMSVMFGESTDNLYRCLCGISWANADKLEPPMLRKVCLRKKKKEE